jgi:hypothetical protein
MDTKKAGRLGGKARAKNLSKQQRSESARNAAIARHSKIHLDDTYKGTTFCGISGPIRFGSADEVNCKRCISAFTNQNQ